MKRSIEWHERTLVNSKASYERLEQEIARLQADLQRIGAANRFTEKQIAEAKRQGKDGFDSDRFLVGKQK